MTDTILVGDLVAEFLQRCGVTTVFGVISIHNIPILDAMGRGNRIRFVMARGEAGAGHMADAYARVGGGLGVVVTSTGPGAANVTGALVEARFAGSPVLHITGQIPTASMGRDRGSVHEVPDQAGMLRAVSKATYLVRSAETALGTLLKAANEALSPPMGPVSVEIPIDIQRTAIPRPATLEDVRLAPSPPAPPDPAALDELARRIAGASRPMLWLGNGARHAGPEALRLIGLGIGVVTSWAGRGTVPEDHPMTLGALNGWGAPAIEAFYETVDLMLVTGSRLRGHETRDQKVPLPKTLVQVDVDPQADNRSYRAAYFVRGDSAAVLAGLADRLEGRMSVDPDFSADLARARHRAATEYRDWLGPYGSFAAQLREVMPRDAVWVRDVTLSNSSWGHRLFPVYGPRDNVFPVGAAIGPGMQMGIGAALAAPGRKTVAMCGDGGFFLNMTELWTAVQENVDLTLIVMNDRGYGVIKHIQDALYDGRHYYGDLAGPDLEGLAKLAGIPFWKVSREDAFGPAAGQAMARSGPTLVEVDMTAIGPFPRYFT